MKGIKIILKKIGDSFKTRKVRYGGYAALITLAVIAGIILINLIMGQFTPQIDLTDNRMFSLSEQTLQVIDSVDSAVTIHGLWRPGQERSDIIAVLDLYLARNKNFTLNIVDPLRYPGLVQKFDKDNEGISPGSIVVEGPKGFRLISPREMYDLDYSRASYENPNPSVTGIAVERRLTSALLYAASGTTPAIYEIFGHQEISLGDLGMQETVEQENYRLQTLNLVQSDIPSDASALILNWPRSDLNQREAEKILGYLEKGGRFFVLVDYRIGELPVLNEVLASYGMGFEYGRISENNPLYNPVYATGLVNLEIPDAAEHDITAPLKDKTETPVVLVDAMGIKELDVKRRSVELKPLLISSPESFLRTDLNETSSNRTVSDLPGPHVLAMTAMDPSWIQGNEPQTRIVAIGSGSLLLYGSEFPWNLDLFMNSLTWLEDRPENLSVRSKSLFILPMRLNGLQIIIFGLLFVIVIPLALFAGGLITWLKRRHL
jgi:hypothetical protein